jgi:hypothetical protein
VGGKSEKETEIVFSKVSLAFKKNVATPTTGQSGLNGRDANDAEHPYPIVFMRSINSSK